jgi:ankyrin repeat protein
VQSGSLFRVEDLLRLGADVKARDSSGRTALHLAAMMGHLDMAKALVMAGSDIHALCRLNKRPLEYAKEGAGPYFNSVANFLEEEHESGYVRHRANTSLHLEVTEFEYFWIDAVSSRWFRFQTQQH